MIRSEAAGERAPPGWPIAFEVPCRETPLDATALSRRAIGEGTMPGRPRRVLFELRPRPTGVRVLSRLEPGLAAAYAGAGARVASAIETRLGPEVAAERVARLSTAPPGVALRGWRPARGALLGLAERHRGPILRTDVASCYASISAAVTAERLLAMGASVGAAIACERLLRELADEGVEGLPVGPAASAVLANAVLAAGDRALARTGVPFVRWVDDWWILVRAPDHAVETLADLGAALLPLGLRLNEAKTSLDRALDATGASRVAEYHRAAHADAVSLVPRADAVVPVDGRMGARRREARRAGGQR